MDKLVFYTAVAILVLWIISVVISFISPSRTINPSVQIAMVALTTFLFGEAWLGRRGRRNGE